MYLKSGMSSTDELHLSTLATWNGPSLPQTSLRRGATHCAHIAFGLHKELKALAWISHSPARLQGPDSFAYEPCFDGAEVVKHTQLGPTRTITVTPRTR